MPSQRHIAALDGLRFVAASTVMISHATYQLYPPGNWGAMSFTVWNLTHLANFGMTLFFVLSGFVIHWNYRHAVQHPGGLRAFFVARWSRLYPLFLIVFVLGAIEETVIRGHLWRMLETTPYFLTFTTTWWYWQFDGLHIFEAINAPMFAVIWSLSTEAFFYFAYPLLAPIAAKLTQRTAAFCILITGAIGAITGLAFVRYSNEIMSFAARYFGIHNGQQFLFWLGFLSPWMRLPAFLIGVFSAQLVLSGLRMRPVVADIAAILCLASIIALAQYGTLLAMVDSSVLVICFAGICLAAATAGTRMGTILAAPLMIYGGEASYSLYLLHDPILWSVARAISHTHLPAPALWISATVALAVVVARLSYVRIERPAQKFFRSVGHDIFRLSSRKPRYESASEAVRADAYGHDLR